jgi:hypothetical protein
MSKAKEFLLPAHVFADWFVPLGRLGGNMNPGTAPDKVLEQLLHIQA